MRALQFTAYGGPEVLTWGDAPVPHAGLGQIRIAVRAASVNPADWKLLAGAMSGGQPLAGTGYLGYDAAGVHQRAAQIAKRTGQATFDVETRLVREELAQPDRHVVAPTRCPGCGEPAAWVTIEPLTAAAARAIDPVGPRG